MVNRSTIYLMASFGIAAVLGAGLFVHRRQKARLSFSNAWHISEQLFDYIRSHVPEGSTILEFGSGWGSSQLAKHYTVWSVEHNKNWLNKYPTNYIYAPIKNNWYDPEVLKRELPQKYDLLLIDGPPGFIGRMGFLNHLDLFNLDVPIIVDDINRKPELELLYKLAELLDRKPIIINSGVKKFGVLPI